MNEDKLIEYERVLHAHDWWFEFSDDQRVWTLGRMSLAYLRELQRDVDPDYVIWNSVAPPDFHGKPRE